MNREEMVRIPAGSFTMGSVAFYAEEGPVRQRGEHPGGDQPAVGGGQGRQQHGHEHQDS